MWPCSKGVQIDTMPVYIILHTVWEQNDLVASFLGPFKKSGKRPWYLVFACAHIVHKADVILCTGVSNDLYHEVTNYDMYMYWLLYYMTKEVSKPFAQAFYSNPSAYHLNLAVDTGRSSHHKCKL